MRVLAQNLLRAQAYYLECVIHDRCGFSLAACQLELGYRHVEYVIDPKKGLNAAYGSWNTAWHSCR